MINIDELDFDKLNGLIPAIITDALTGEVLMLGFMNKESLSLTIEKKLVTFFSRTKKRLWTKGETSGNYLHVTEIHKDCDNDTLLIKARADGPVCHNGTHSCFNTAAQSKLDFLNELFELIKERKSTLPENSYTTKLFQRGTNRIIQKVGEEAIETVIAAKNRDKHEIVNEVSDLVYHLFVMLVEQDIEFSEIVSNLASRHK
jgi:phosphoribosyl-ATP pyrophosphohydrolase/phosphoribosyl-AMP cyclohydrolase